MPRSLKSSILISCDIAPIAVVRVPLSWWSIIVSSKALPEFIAYAKRTAQNHMASAGTGSTPHVAGELLKMMAGVDMVHVPYRGGAPAITDLLGGQVQVFFGTTVMIGHISAGGCAGWRSRPQLARKRCFPTPGNSCRATRQATGLASLPPRHPPKSSISSTRRSMPASLIPRSRRGLSSRAQCLQGRPQPSGAHRRRNRKWAKVVKFSGAKPMTS